MRHRLGILLAIVTVAVVTFSMTFAQASTSAKKAKEVKVKLFEFQIKPKPKSAAAGKIRFVAKNIGTEQHEMVIVVGDDPAALPTDADGAVDESQIDEADLPGEIEEFDAGKTKKKAFNLAAGSYILFCNITDEDESGALNHFAEGMYTTFVVK